MAEPSGESLESCAERSPVRRARAPPSGLTVQTEPPLSAAGTTSRDPSGSQAGSPDMIEPMDETRSASWRAFQGAGRSGAEGA